MHKTRIITGFLLGLLAIWAVFGFSPRYFQILTAAVLSLAVWEWTSFFKYKHPAFKVGYLIVFWLVTLIAQHHLKISLWLANLFWALTLIALFIPKERLMFLKNNMVIAVIGMLFMSPLWIFANLLHEQSHQLLFFLILAVCFADTGAYFIGCHFGKHLLAPKLSPKKTWEGLFGGLVIGSIAAMIMSLFTPEIHGAANYLAALVLALLIILVSVVGDLSESLLKRLFDLKDSSQLLPGHGGVLDRLDSLCAAVPVFFALCCLLGWI